MHTALIPQALSDSERSAFGAFVAATPAQPSAVLADVVDVLLDAFPDACREADIYGDLALHCAAAFAPLAVVERVYQRFPGARSATNERFRTPLAEACIRQAPVDVVRFLLEKYPEGARKRERQGRAPLHLAALFAAPADTRCFELIVFPLRSARGPNRAKVAALCPPPLFL